MSLLKAMLMGEQAPIQDSFKVVTYVGTGTERAITGVGFQPDFVWIKCRSNAAHYHTICDSVRGVGQRLHTNTTGAEAYSAGSIVTFDEDGFTVGNNSNENQISETYVAWCWKADNAGVTDATQEEQYNAGAGLSIIKYVGDGVSGREVTHSLGRVPKLIIIKNLSTSVSWYVHTNELGIGYYLKLDTTDDKSVDGGIRMTDDPTSSTLTLGDNWYTNSSSNNYIAYCFAEVPNISSIGSYTGTGAAGNVVNFSDEIVSGDDLKVDTTGGLGTGWSDTGTFEWSCDGTQPGITNLQFNDMFTVGLRYEISVVATNVTAGDYRIYEGSAYSDYAGGNGEFIVRSTQDATHMYIQGDTDFTGTITVTYVKEVIPQGFQPAHLMIKRTDVAGSWILLDNKRDTHNPNSKVLSADLSNAESDSSGYNIHFTSTGFIVDGTSTDINVSGSNYIYMSFAELPQESSPENRDEPLFGQIAYTGDAVAGHSIDGLNFKPDMLWFKNRETTNNHMIFDSIRGSAKVIYPNDTSAEAASTAQLVSIDADGFTLGTAAAANGSGNNIMAWAWNAGGEAVPNEDGSIDSTVMANVEGGFSIVKWTGTGVNGTIGHGLGTSPEIVIIKSLGLVEYWRVGHTDLTSWVYSLSLSEGLVETSTPAVFNSTAPTASAINIGTDTSVNTSGEEYIAYCWTSKSGVSDFSSYTGTGAAGKAVTLGFKPDMLIIRRTDVADNWGMYDSRRNTLNPIDSVLYSNASSVEGTGHDIDFTDTGFELNDGDAAYNASGGNYIYMAFKVAEDPDTLHQVETGDLLISDSIDDDNGTHTVTSNGGYLTTSAVACGSNSIIFDNVFGDDYMYIPAHSDFNYGSGDFTIDFWVYRLDGARHVIYNQYTDASNNILLDIDENAADNIHFASSTGGVYDIELKANTGAAIAGEFIHVALVRYSNEWFIYINGQMQTVTLTNGSYSCTLPSLTSNLDLGGRSNATTLHLDGYLDQIRITKGTALWTTTNFNLSDKGLYYPSGTLQI